MKEHCKEYLHYLVLEKNASRNTIASYKLDLNRYVAFLEHNKVRNVNAITESDATRFLGSLRERQLSPRSITRTLSAIKGFHKFLVGDGGSRSER